MATARLSEFLDNLDGISFGIVNLKIARSLAVFLDGSNYDSARRQDSSHSADPLCEQDQRFDCPVVPSSRECDRLPAFTELVSRCIRLLQGALDCFAKAKFLDIPRGHGIGVSNEDAGILRD